MTPSSSRNGAVASPFNQGGLLSKGASMASTTSTGGGGGGAGGVQGQRPPFNAGSLLSRVDANDSYTPSSPLSSNSSSAFPDARTWKRMGPEERKQYVAETQKRARNDGRPLLDLQQQPTTGSSTGAGAAAGRDYSPQGNSLLALRMRSKSVSKR
jgi:hypothetical protein